VSGGRDPFEWLPDELIVIILIFLPLSMLNGSVCKRVCQRWAQLMESAPIVRHRRNDGRWAAYESGDITPHILNGHADAVWALAVDHDGKVYSGSKDMTIRVWLCEGANGAHLHTLEGHTDWVRSLAIGLNGEIYSGSDDKTIKVWSSVSGELLRSLAGHTGWVMALAVGLDGKIYSGSADKTIGVWSGDEAPICRRSWGTRNT